MTRMKAIMLAAGLAMPAIAMAQETVPAVPIRPAGQKPAPVAPPDGSPEEQLEKIKKAEKDFDAALRAYTNRRMEANELTKSILAGDPKSEAYMPAVMLASKTGGMLGTQSTAIYANVMKHHAANPKIKELLPTLARQLKGEEYLEKIAKENLDRETKAMAIAMLADNAYTKIDREKNLDTKKELAKKAKLIFERMSKEFGDVVYRGAKLDDTAEAALYSLNNLQVGMVVPEVEGPDMDGKTFKISDYRGKVVLLDFWGHW